MSTCFAVGVQRPDAEEEFALLEQISQPGEHLIHLRSPIDDTSIVEWNINSIKEVTLIMPLKYELQAAKTPPAKVIIEQCNRDVCMERWPSRAKSDSSLDRFHVPVSSDDRPGVWNYLEELLLTVLGDFSVRASHGRWPTIHIAHVCFDGKILNELPSTVASPPRDANRYILSGPGSDGQAYDVVPATPKSDTRHAPLPNVPTFSDESQAMVPNRRTPRPGFRPPSDVPRPAHQEFFQPEPLEDYTDLMRTDEDYYKTPKAPMKTSSLPASSPVKTTDSPVPNRLPIPSPVSQVCDDEPQFWPAGQSTSLPSYVRSHLDDTQPRQLSLGHDSPRARSQSTAIEGPTSAGALPAHSRPPPPPVSVSTPPPIAPRGPLQERLPESRLPPQRSPSLDVAQGAPGGKYFPPSKAVPLKHSRSEEEQSSSATARYFPPVSPRLPSSSSPSDSPAQTQKPRQALLPKPSQAAGQPPIAPRRPPLPPGITPPPARSPTALSPANSPTSSPVPRKTAGAVPTPPPPVTERPPHPTPPPAPTGRSPRPPTTETRTPFGYKPSAKEGKEVTESGNDLGYSEMIRLQKAEPFLPPRTYRKNYEKSELEAISRQGAPPPVAPRPDNS